MATQWYWPPAVGALDILLKIRSTFVGADPHMETSSPIQTKTDRLPSQMNRNPYISPAGPPLDSA